MEKFNQQANALLLWAKENCEKLKLVQWLQTIKLSIRSSCGKETSFYKLVWQHSTNYKLMQNNNNSSERKHEINIEKLV